jgi:hypothetical protein
MWGKVEALALTGDIVAAQGSKPLNLVHTHGMCVLTEPGTRGGSTEYNGCVGCQNQITP